MRVPGSLDLKIWTNGPSGTAPFTLLVLDPARLEQPAHALSIARNSPRSIEMSRNSGPPTYEIESLDPGLDFGFGRRLSTRVVG